MKLHLFELNLVPQNQIRMRFNIKMPVGLKNSYLKELELYRDSLENADLAIAWRHLERSHILGQQFPLEHTWSHWLMLRFGFRIKSFKEILGQLPRLLVGGVKSFIGVIPVGNTGGANVPPLKPMPIPEDLLPILKKNRQDVY